MSVHFGASSVILEYLSSCSIGQENVCEKPQSFRVPRSEVVKQSANQDVLWKRPRLLVYPLKSVDSDDLSFLR